jgi:microcin C transport system substrate-binding protein
MMPQQHISRRGALIAGAGALSALLELPRTTFAAGTPEEIERHGLSIFGDLKYPADFGHFDYVDPNAPKGGMFSQIGPSGMYNQNLLTFNSLNAFILKGDAAQGMEFTFATLMVRALDEPDAVYGLAARAVRVSPDGLTYTFLLRPEARFHDGSALTAHDVAFTLNLLKEQGHPQITIMLRDMLGVEAIDDHTAVVRYREKRARDVPLFVTMLPIFSRTYYTLHPFDQSSLDIPLGSGAYRVGDFVPGRFIAYERVQDWWGAKFPVSIGLNNFDTLRYEFYRDRDVGFEGFTGKTYLFREEFTSRTWATRYDFPAIREGRVKKDVIPDNTPSGAQGWFINTRRQKFKNPKLREALNYAFDFEWTNKNIMYGAYDRTCSVFQNSDMMAKGPPGVEELALLEPFRGKVPDEVFGEPFMPPVSDGSGQDRGLLRKAAQLLTDAGITTKNAKRILPNGEPLTIEFLIDEPTFEPHHMLFMKNLRLIGIETSLRQVDPVQFKKREDDFDFDIVVNRATFSSTPGDTLRSYFSSAAAAQPGSQNLAGVADPAIDAMIERIIAADSRPALITACRALDRLFRAGRYWVPQWYKATHWIAFWDVFGQPATKPRYARGVPDTWWYDRDKAANLQRAG